MSGCRGKESWPELVGIQGEVAERIIEKQNHFVNAMTILEGTIVTADFRCDRVRVWVNNNGIVTKVPRIG